MSSLKQQLFLICVVSECQESKSSYLGDVGSVSLIRLQSRGQPQNKSSQCLTGSGEFYSSPNGSLHGQPQGLQDGKLASSRSNPEKRKNAQDGSFWNPRSYIPSLLLYAVGIHKPILIQCRKELHKGENTRKQGSLRAILEAGYHNLSSVTLFLHVAN